MILIEGQQKAPSVFDGWGINTLPHSLICISRFDRDPFGLLLRFDRFW
jgi:hypothetical protein